MSLAKQLAYQDMPLKVKKSNLRTVDDVGSFRLMNVLIGRHKLGLSITMNFVLLCVIAWPHGLHTWIGFFRSMIFS